MNESKLINVWLNKGSITAMLDRYIGIYGNSRLEVLKNVISVWTLEGVTQ